MASLRTSLLSKGIAACSSQQLLQLERQVSLLRISTAHIAASKAAGSQVLAQKRHRTSIHREGPPETEKIPGLGSDWEMDMLLDRMTSDGIPKPLPQNDASSLEGLGGFENKTDEVPQLGGYVRALPVSRSYFSRQASFNDNYVHIQQLFRKHGTLPAVPANQVKRVSWRTLRDYKEGAREDVRAAEYKKCLAMAKRLYLIHPKLKPAGLMDSLGPFIRSIQEAETVVKTKELDKFGRAIGVGRRKTSTARAWVVEGTGEMIVNGKSLTGAFSRIHDRESATWALKATDRTDKYNVWALVEGGGTTGQAEALTLAVARALLTHEPALKTSLRKAGCIQRDPRMVERKKHGRVKARKRPAWVKR
ncbi:37S ribosomal protein S9, mitochondrial [Sporothrix eucalyptigena]|uniref:Small ribosomal subunit protein uS9m n=1 Tax=Sporothrix eucalyptigena TaxID=1812306 RepID=A0ABP0AYI9_9PEZI